MQEDESYTDGYRTGYVKGYDKGIEDGRYQGYRDAKFLAYQAFKDDLNATTQLEKAVGEL